ncbi:hypothetical protein LguiA_008830 [Lonicera macranthoides]
MIINRYKKDTRFLVGWFPQLMDSGFGVRLPLGNGVGDFIDSDDGGYKIEK